MSIFFNGYNAIFQKLCLLVTILFIYTCAECTTIAQAQNPKPPTPPKPNTTNRNLPKGIKVNIPSIGLPGRRENGGTRNPQTNCIASEPAILQLLLPPTNVGLTTAAYPRFFWYTPKNTSQRAEFSLYKVDKAIGRSLVYNTTFNLNSGGVSSLALPSDVGMPPLTINQMYQWSVSLVCNLQDTSAKSVIRVDGWVQRVNVRDAVQVQELTEDSAVASSYAQQGLWLDLLSTLAQLRACKPYDRTVSNTWASVLNQAALEKVAQQPLFSKCANPGSKREQGNSRN
jgi:hypothetical protein